MPTTVADTVVLPNGAVPANGHIYFTCLEAPAVATLATVVTAPLGSTGAFSITLDGAPYAVRVEHWADGRLQINHLPNVVPSGTGSATLAEISAVTIPANARTDHTHKRGDTINWPVQFVDEYDRPVSLVGSAVTSAFRGPDGVTRALVVVVTDAANGWTEVGYTAAKSAMLPLGKHQWDAAIRTGTVVIRTPTSTITIIDEVTQ